MELTRFKVKGNCMVPTFSDGDTLFIDTSCNSLDEVCVGDIVLFKLGEKVLAHRILFIYKFENLFQTKADAFILLDKRSQADSILGKVVYIREKLTNRIKSTRSSDLRLWALSVLNELNLYYDVIHDIGCGAGTMAISAARYGYCIVAIDIQNKAVEECKENVIKANLQDRIHVLNSSWQELNPESVKVITLFNTLHHMIYPLDEMNGMLKKFHELETLIVIDYKDEYLDILYAASILRKNRVGLKSYHPIPKQKLCDVSHMLKARYPNRYVETKNAFSIVCKIDN